MASNASISSFPSSQNDDFAQQEVDKIHMVRWKSGKSVDPRLLVLLKLFREIFVERRQIFKKIFPGHHREFIELFKKIGAALSKEDANKVQTMQRSVSFDLSHQESNLRLERFRVRTPDVKTGTGDQQGTGQGGQGCGGNGGHGNTESKN